MKRIIYAFLFTIFCFPITMQACDCAYFKNFCETVAPTATVFEGEILSIFTEPLAPGLDKTYMDIVISEYLHNAVQHDTLSVLAGYGTTCDPNLGDFYVGGKMIIGFEEIEDPLADHYPLIRLTNPCSVNFLYPDSYDLETFKTDLENCLLTTHIPDREEVLRLATIYPNPTANSFFLHSPFDAISTNVKLLSPNGQLIFDFEFSNFGNHEFDLSHFPKGVYFLEIQVGDVSVTKKVLKY